MTRKIDKLKKRPQCQSRSFYLGKEKGREIDGPEKNWVASNYSNYRTPLLNCSEMPVFEQNRETAD